MEVECAMNVILKPRGAGANVSSVYIASSYFRNYTPGRLVLAARARACVPARELAPIA